MKRLSRTVFVAVLAVGMVVALAGVAIASTTAAPSGRSASAHSGRHDGVADKKKKKHKKKKKKAATSTTVAAPASVKVGTTSLGSVLVGTDGKTLYLLDRDQGTTSACTGGCQSVWPPLTATGSPTAGTGVDPAKLSHAMQADGKDQITYAGHLLYHFSGDTAAGDTKGTAIAGWHAVSPDGTALGG